MYLFRRRQNKGATMVECALVLLVTLLLIFGSLEIGLLVIRSNAVAESARRGARAAIVRGSAAHEMTPLGPETMQFTADADNDIARACRAVLPTMLPAQVDCEVEWPTGSNDLEAPVVVTVHYTHEFTVPLLNAFGNVDLSSTSTMSIAR